MNTAFATVGVTLPPTRASPHGRRPGARLLCASGSADRQDELKRTMEGLRRTVAEAKDIAGQYAAAFEEDEEEEEEEFDDFEEDVIEESDPSATVPVSSTAPPLKELFRSSHPRVKVALRTGIYIGGIGLAALFCPGLVLDVIRRLSSAMAVAIDTVFIQLGGLMCLMFGSYYVGAALDDHEGNPPLRFYRTTVTMRLAFAAATVVLWASHGGGHHWLVILGLINAGSSWALSKTLGR